MVPFKGLSDQECTRFSPSSFQLIVPVKWLARFCCRNNERKIARTWRFSSHQKTTISYSLLTRYIDVYHCESDLSLSKWKTTKNKNYISNLFLMNARAHMLENSFLHTLDKGIKLSNDLLYQSLLMVYAWNISVWWLKYLCLLSEMKNLYFMLPDFLNSWFFGFSQKKKLKKNDWGMFDRQNGKIVIKLCKMFWKDI